MQTARRALPVRGKGRAHLLQRTKNYEASFSLTRADSRQVLKGDSSVSQPAGCPSASRETQPSAVQETGKGIDKGMQVGRPGRHTRLGVEMGRSAGEVGRSDECARTSVGKCRVGESSGGIREEETEKREYRAGQLQACRCTIHRRAFTRI